MQVTPSPSPQPEALQGPVVLKTGPTLAPVCLFSVFSNTNFTEKNYWRTRNVGV